MTMQQRFAGLLAGLTLLLLAAPSGAAMVDGSGQTASEATAGAQAMIDADVEAHVDASGAVEAAEDAEASAREEATARYEATVDTVDRAHAEANATAQNESEHDVDTESRVRGGAETVSEVRAHHRDEANESADTDNEYVDAGADAGVVADASAFLEGTGHVLVEGAATVDDLGNDLAESVAAGVDTVFGASGQAEGQATATGSSALETDGPEPGVEPEASVDADASTVTEATTEGYHQAQGDVDT